MKQKKRWSFALSVLAGLLQVGPLIASTVPQGPNPDEVVRMASSNELHPSGPDRPFRFRVYESDVKGSTLKEVIETKDGEISRLLQKNGTALDPAEERREIDRLESLLVHPALQAQKHKKEQQESDHSNELVRLLPDAFVYTYSGISPGPSGPCFHLHFEPKPTYTPPDREGEVFHGMEGELWIDQTQLRLVKIDAHLISDVNFGWGFFGKLYKGGTILVEDADVGWHHWETTQVKLKLQGKILMVKSTDFSDTQNFSDYEPVAPQLGYQDAIRMVLKDSSSSRDR